MHAKWVGAALAAGLALWFGWGLAGLVTVGCAPHPRGGCGVPDGGGKYFAAMMIAPASLVLLFKTGFHRRDWRPALGYSAGAVAGAVVALVMGTSLGHWIVALVLVSSAALVPWCTWWNSDAVREARQRERAQRQREERLAQARARRSRRRRERRQRQREQRQQQAAGDR
ncbi:hypothetical protein ACFQ8O_01430 [Streptomyces coelicoflavus]|uniref:hypothetical protein n=1 Tax=Streptomyces coelicoflavus TaxID=285562 RepID=UPI0036A6DCD7